MKKQIALIAFLMLTLLSRGAEAPAPKVVFSGSVVEPDAKGTHRHLHITIRDWRLDSDEGGPQTVALPVFSVMTLRSGRIQTTIGPQTDVRQADDIWSGKAGTVMKVTVLSQSAILRVLAVAE